MLRFLLLIGASFLLQACFSIKPLTFRQADHFTVANAFTTPDISFDLVFANPNSFGCTVKKITTQASVNNGNLFTYELEKSVRVKAGSEFTVPIHVSMPLEDLIKTLPSALNLLKDNQSVPFQLSGTITLKKFIFKKTFSFSWKG